MSRTLTVYLAADLKRFSSGMKDADRQAQGLGGTFKNLLGPALLGAGVAAGALAVKLGVEGVQAAIEDEKAAAALAQTLNNLGLAHDTKPVEEYIYQLERAYGVADTELRPAYDRLIRSTRDVDEANRALQISMDIAASTGKSLETVTDALGRAYDGNTAGLSRLGLGIDKTTLATADFDDIMNQLASTFAGQADASAQTFEGQLKRLTTATDNLKEAFGAGLLEALGDTDDTTQDLVDTMEGLEPVIRSIGQEAGETASGLAALAAQVADLAPEADTTSAKVANLGGEINATFGFGGILDAPQNIANIISGTRWLADQNYRLEQRLKVTQQILDDHVDYLDAFARGAHRAATGQRDLNAATGAATDETSDYRYEVEGAYGALARMYAPLQQYYGAQEEVNRATGGARRETNELTKAQEKLQESYELQGIAFQTSKRELIDQIGELEKATAAVEAYAGAIQQDLLAGFDLGALAGANLNEAGQLNAGQFFQGFDEAINQAQWFGGVLSAIKAAGADQSLLEELASLGPEVGGALGQELLDKGLVPELLNKWSTVQSTTKDLALGLVPEYLEAGRLSAIENLNGLAQQFGEDQQKFKRLGNKLGQQVGDEFSKRMLKEIADAVREVEAIATAARAERVAEAQAAQARITEQAVADAISNLIRNSDQRTGRNVQPILQ